MKWPWHNTGFVISGVLLIIGVPGIIEDLSTWESWISEWPSRWWIAPLASSAAFALFEGGWRLGRRSGRASPPDIERPKREVEPRPQAMPAPRHVPPSEPAARIYTPRSLHELTSLAEGKTQLEAERAIQPHLEKWTSASGALKELKQGFTFHDEPEKYSAMIDCSAQIDGEPKYLAVHLEFDATWKHRLEMFSLEDRITAHGKIKDISALGVSLEECELDDT